MAEKEHIEREALNVAIHESWRSNPHNNSIARQTHNHEHRHFLSLLHKQPAADVVEVVRCRECINYIPYTEDDIKYGHVVKGTDGVCLLRIDANAENLFVAVSNNDFCSYGAKMDGKDDE